MSKIIIRNVGPIKEAEFELNKVNVFMGPQSSGKSTIAKICSQCCWYEKNYLLTGEEYDFHHGLIEFHRIDKNYFSDDSEITYESQWITVNLKGKKGITTTKKNNSELLQIFNNLKIEFIPAERNFASTIPNLQKYNESYDNIINFLNDWMTFKEIITNTRKFNSPLNSINISYKYDSKTKEDILTLPNKKTISLQRSSSGQQSLTPLLVVSAYLFKELYNQKRNPSPVESKHIRELLPDDMKEDYNWIIETQNFQLNTNKRESEKLIEETKRKIWKKIGFSTDYVYSNVIIEEPEQNLFPETQKELIYYLLNEVNDKDRDHKLLLTTHSPYILYAINNCMMGHLVKDKMEESKKIKLDCNLGIINPISVSIWQIKEGGILKIQAMDGLIGQNYFDENMKAVMDDFYKMLNYYGQ